MLQKLWGFRGKKEREGKVLEKLGLLLKIRQNKRKNTFHLQLSTVAYNRIFHDCSYSNMKWKTT